jgi:iron complex outermembrane recepter protein
MISLQLALGIQEKGSFIKGRVSDEKGTSLAGAGITVVSTFLGTYSGTDGKYIIKLPGDGVYTLKFSFTGYEPVVREINVRGEAVVDVSLNPMVVMAGEVVVSSTRAGDKAPFAYSNVSPETIRKQNSGQDLPFLISLTPSLVETSEAGTGIGYTGFRIRGTDGSRINVTIDGIPLNDAESQQVFWVDLPDLSSSVESIQVQRGVGTSSNGSGAFGASVNIQSKSPENTAYAEINSTAGSYNTFKNTVMTGTGLLSGKFSLEMRYSDIKSDGYIKRTGVENRSAAISGAYRGTRSTIKANIILGEEHTGISWWGVPSDMLSADRRYNPAGEYLDAYGNKQYYDNESDNYWQDHYQLLYTIKLNRYLSLNTAFHYTTGKGYYEEYGQDQLYSDYGLPVVMIDTSHLYSTDLVRRKWMRNNFYGMVYSLNYNRNRVETALGGGINNYEGRHFGRIIWMRNAGNTEKDHQWYFNRADKFEMNIYGKLNYKFTESLSVFGDLQYRHIFYKLKGPDDDLKDISQTHLFNFFNPKAGIYYSISKNQHAFLSVSVANKEPTRSDYKEAAGDNKATPRPETLYDAEGGYEYNTSALKLGMTLFGMFYKDQLVPTGQLSSVGYPIMTNVKSSYRTGIEFTVKLKPFNKFEWDLNSTVSRNKITGFVEYYTDYNTTDWSSQYKSKNLGTVDIAYSPAITGTSDISYMILKNLRFHVLSKYVGHQYFDNTMSKSRMIDPYFVNNLRIDYEATMGRIKHIDLQLFVNNIFNLMYESNGYGGDWYENGMEKTWAYYFPQAGTNFLLKLGVKF